jgi:hypothetical protein
MGDAKAAASTVESAVDAAVAEGSACRAGSLLVVSSDSN